MSLYHGTSATNALKIILSNAVLPSKNGFFYCFDAARPESMAGALCFATGDGPRNGSIQGKDFFSQYAQLNPDFPKGIKGGFTKAALKMAASAWVKRQLQTATSALDYCGAILVFQSHPDATPRTRKGIVHEVEVPERSLDTLIVQKIYLDDALVNLPEVQALKAKGISIAPLSECVEEVRQSCQTLKSAQSQSKTSSAPKP